MNTTIFLIRHGQIDNPKNVIYGGNLELKLTEEGGKQIEEIARKIKKMGFNITKIYSSPMKRTISSSKIIEKVFGLKTGIILEKDLKDVNIPALAGKSLSLRKQILKKGEDEYSNHYVKMGNESRDSIANRMTRTFYKIAKENNGKTVAILSHGDPLRFLLYRLDKPSGKVPGMNILIKTGYPKKGEAVKVVLNKNLKVVEKVFL